MLIGPFEEVNRRFAEAPVLKLGTGPPCGFTITTYGLPPGTSER